MTRYIFLCIEKRRIDAPRTLGILFHHFCQEAEDCTLLESLGKILGVVMENLHELKKLPANILERILELFQKNMYNYASKKGLILNENSLLDPKS